ncbi:MAG: type IX secretion system membrane protein PorP/SprF [Haliscomenobacteraceae bacterium CHB4]|nr:hypothetical protein [Saprospiraceae bacterium]MCE7924007.1 type IX secretion system membrane protein PorP/SprF [Haliscomenobacteraceae bacterium CHB4]
MKKLLLYSLLFCTFLPEAFSQDKHFTQFYATPLTLNPALTGAFEGKYRVGTIYRDQWRQVLDNPIRTFAIAADLRLKAPVRKVTEDAFGLGLMFFTDKVSVVDFSTTQIAVSMAYHKSLGASNTQFLTLGLQGGLTQRNVTYGSFDFHDEFDGISGYTMGSGEALPENNFSFSDLNVGLNYSAEVGYGGRIFAGLGMHHVTSPQISFYGNSGDGDKLYRKFSAQLAANVPFDRENRVAMLPRFLIASQGPHMEINTGTNFRIALGQYGGSALHLGSWVRFVRNDDAVGHDAVVALVGFEFSNVLIGMSYDLNLRALEAKQRQSAFEISIAYLGEYENEEVLCPKF